MALRLGDVGARQSGAGEVGIVRTGEPRPSSGASRMCSVIVERATSKRKCKTAKKVVEVGAASTRVDKIYGHCHALHT